MARTEPPGPVVCSASGRAVWDHLLLGQVTRGGRPVAQRLWLPSRWEGKCPGQVLVVVTANRLPSIHRAFLQRSRNLVLHGHRSSR